MKARARVKQENRGYVNRLACSKCLVSGEQSEVKKSKKNEEGSLFSSLLSLLRAARWDRLQRISKRLACWRVMFIKFFSMLEVVETAATLTANSLKRDSNHPDYIAYL